MIFRKYNPYKRDRIVICLPDIESVVGIKMNTLDQIKTTLESLYMDAIIDSPPYNYIVYSGGVYEIKSPDIAHTDNSFLAAFNDDIKILVLERDFLKSKQSEIVDLVASISERYSLRLENFLTIATFSMTADVIDQTEIIMKESIISRNIKKPIMSICETVIDGEIITNPNIVIESNRGGSNKLYMVANKYSIPIETLISLNPHVDPYNLLITDIIFLPSVASITSKREGLSTLKYATYLYDTCTYVVKRGLDTNG